MGFPKTHTQGPEISDTVIDAHHLTPSPRQGWSCQKLFA